MKTIIFALLMALSFTASAERQKYKDPSQHQGQLQGQAQKQQQHQGQAQGQLQGQIANSKSANDQSVSLRHQYDRVANSAAELNLAYCSDGASAQNDQGGFSVGQVNYVCEAVASLKVSLLLVEMELAAHDKSHDSQSPDWTHIDIAHGYMQDAENIMKDVVSYIQGRRNTAGISAASKDLAWPVGLVALLFFLL